MRLVGPEGALDVFSRNLVEAARQDGRILDRGCCALGHVGRHWMTRVTEQAYPAVAPARQRLTLENRPLVTIGARLQHHAHLGMKSLVSLAQLANFSLRRPGLLRQPIGRLRNAGDEVKLAAIPPRVIKHDVPVDAPPLGSRWPDVAAFQERRAEHRTVGNAATVYGHIGADDSLTYA